MEYVTVYEISENYFPWHTVFFSICCIFSVYGFIRCFKEHINTKKVFSGDLVGSIFFILLIAITFILAYSSHLSGGSFKGEDAQKYYSGEYFEVTGVVEQYQNINDSKESFCVNGIVFNYSTRYDMQWEKFQDYDNVIYKDGQKLKIRYILDENDDPEIVYVGEIGNDNVIQDNDAYRNWWETFLLWLYDLLKF